MQDTINAVAEELGLTKSLPVPGGGTLEYALEEVWNEGDTESEIFSTRISV